MPDRPLLAAQRIAAAALALCGVALTVMVLSPAKSSLATDPVAAGLAVSQPDRFGPARGPVPRESVSVDAVAPNLPASAPAPSDRGALAPARSVTVEAPPTGAARGGGVDGSGQLETPPDPAGAGCPALGLDAPDRRGGTASLVPVIPLFGSFSPEAFAFLPVFEPVLEMFGPALVAGERVFDASDPVLDVAVAGAAATDATLWPAAEPHYGPYRGAVLGAEAAGAAALGPAVEAVAGGPLGDCAAAAQAAILEPLT